MSAADVARHPQTDGRARHAGRQRDRRSDPSGDAATGDRSSATRHRSPPRRRRTSSSTACATTVAHSRRRRRQALDRMVREAPETAYEQVVHGGAAGARAPAHGRVAGIVALSGHRRAARELAVPSGSLRAVAANSSERAGRPRSQGGAARCRRTPTQRFSAAAVSRRSCARRGWCRPSRCAIPASPREGTNDR